jgi:hypothetical protein
VLPDAMFSDQKFWSVLPGQTLVNLIDISSTYSTAIWYILWPLGIFCGHFGIFSRLFWHFYQEQSGNPGANLVASLLKKNSFPRNPIQFSHFDAVPFRLQKQCDQIRCSLSKQSPNGLHKAVWPDAFCQNNHPMDCTKQCDQIKCFFVKTTT